MKKFKILHLGICLLSISSFSFASVPLWKDFKTGMSPEEALEVLKSMDLAKISKRTPKINKYPKKPRFGTNSSYDWIPTIKSARISWKPKNRDFLLANHYAKGPFFGFDKDDKLTQLTFRILVNKDNISGSLASLGCLNPIQEVGDNNFNFFKTALSAKYEVIAEDIQYGEGTSVVIFKDEGTRIKLERNTKYEKTTYEAAVYKCNKMTAGVKLTYGDYERISNMISDQNSEDAIDFNKQLDDI